MNFHDVAMLSHNGNLITTAEKLLNEYLSTNTDNHVVSVTLIQPDGSKINIQKGFRLSSVEYTIHPDEPENT